MQQIIISLTSYPARINNLIQTIESLFRQKRQADEIVLWLSILEFPNKYNDLPKDLLCLIGKNGFHIEWVTENIKSHKKYYYALQNSRNIVITADDDMYYSDTMVSTLMDSYSKHPNAISARRVRLITKEDGKLSLYHKWEGEVVEYIGVERMDLCAIGVSGVLYPPGCSKEKWFDIPAIIRYAHNQDDLWLKFNEIVDQIPVVYTGMDGMDCVIEGSQSCGLCVQNVDLGDNDISVNMMSEHLNKEYPAIYSQWYDGLMQTDEMIIAKRQYYTLQVAAMVEQKGEHDIYICGAGKYAHIIYEFIKSCGQEKYIKAFLVTQKKVDKNENEIKIKKIQELDVQESFSVLCGVGKTYRQELKDALVPYKFHEWIDIDIYGIERLLQLESKMIK